MTNSSSVFFLDGYTQKDSLSFSLGMLHEETFSSNTYTGCHEALRGAIFNLQNGAGIVDTNSKYQRNSAFYGGIAYLEGLRTSLSIINPFT